MKEFCYECALIFLVLLTTLSFGAHAGGLNEEFSRIVAEDMSSVIILSLLGGTIGLISRLADPEWLEADSKILVVLMELSSSAFTGIVIATIGQHYAVSASGVIAAILLGSWLGTKAIRLIFLWVRSKYEL